VEAAKKVVANAEKVLTIAASTRSRSGGVGGVAAKFGGSKVASSNTSGDAKVPSSDRPLHGKLKDRVHPPSTINTTEGTGGGDEVSPSSTTSYRKLARRESSKAIYPIPYE
jgi:hypothetical protein